MIDLGSGLTPLVKARNLGDAIGLKELYLKDETVNPTGSFKDRPSSVAVSKAKELGFNEVGCASTGNLASSLAAHASKAKMGCLVFMPSDVEEGKKRQPLIYGAKVVLVKGTYDDANFLAGIASDGYGLAIVNFTLRPYYSEGSKTLGIEVVEQLGWIEPDHIIVPMASGGLLYAIYKGIKEVRETGLVKEERVSISGVQAEGCAPIVKSFKSGSSEIEPLSNPSTSVKSLAIGDPRDGLYAIKAIKDTGGFCEEVSEDDTVNAVKILARTEGIFAEPAGATSVALARKFLEEGVIDRSDKVVCCVTGAGLRVINELSVGDQGATYIVEPKVESLDHVMRGEVVG